MQGSTQGSKPTEGPHEMPDSAKLKRATDLFHQYEQAAEKWVYGGGVRQASVYPGSLAVEFLPAPVEISLLIGDCLQNLRSAMDHEVYGLTVAGRGGTWSGLRDCQFPIYESTESFERDKKRRIGGLPLAAQELIESMQIFASPPDLVAQPLSLLNKLARVDRHRLLHVAAAQPVAFAVKPLVPGALAVEVGMTVRVQFIDPEFMNLDTHQTLVNALSAVAWTIQRIRERVSSTPDV